MLLDYHKRTLIRNYILDKEYRELGLFDDYDQYTIPSYSQDRGVYRFHKLFLASQIKR